MRIGGSHNFHPRVVYFHPGNDFLFMALTKAKIYSNSPFTVKDLWYILCGDEITISLLLKDVEILTLLRPVKPP